MEYRTVQHFFMTFPEEVSGIRVKQFNEVSQAIFTTDPREVVNKRASRNPHNEMNPPLFAKVLLQIPVVSA